MKYAIIEVERKNLKDKWHARIKSPNGEIMFHSQEYSSRSAALKTIDSVVRNRKYLIKIIDGGRKGEKFNNRSGIRGVGGRNKNKPSNLRSG